MLVQYMEGMNRSGRMRGTVAQNNGRLRQFTKPKLVRNANTLAVRSIFSFLTSFFKTLSDAGINSWNSAAGLARSNRMSLGYNVSGKQLFIGLNANINKIAAGTTWKPQFAGTQPTFANPQFPTPPLLLAELLPSFPANALNASGIGASVYDFTSVSFPTNLDTLLVNGISQAIGTLAVANIADMVIALNSFLGATGTAVLTDTAEITISSTDGNVFGAMGLTALTLIPTASTAALSLTLTAIPDNTTMVITATPNQSFGVKRPGNSAFRMIGSVDSNAVVLNPMDILSMYSATFGAPKSGSRIYLRCYCVTWASGQNSLPVQFDAIVS